MRYLTNLLLAAGGLLLSRTASAQTPALADLRTFSQQRYNHQNVLGLSLGGYALANIAVSGIAMTRTTGETRYVHQMNTYWNLVNLGIAGVGLLGLRKQQPATETLGQAIRHQQQIEKVLLFNAGLDVGYIAGGFWLLERAKNRPDQADRLRGYGKTVIAQGAFLLVFDVVNYLIFNKRGGAQQLELVGQTPLGLGVSVPLK